jgi:hypothetical protein
VVNTRRWEPRRRSPLKAEKLEISPAERAKLGSGARYGTRKFRHSLDLDQRPLVFVSNSPIMSQSDEPQSGEHTSKPKPSRLDEARRIIEEYAENLREIIKKLLRRLH